MEVTVEMLGSFFTVLLALASAIVSFWAVAKVVKELQQPSKDREKRIDELEKKTSLNTHAINVLNEASRLMLKSQTVVIEHLTTGDHVSDLEKVNDEIREFLWGHISAVPPKEGDE